MTVSPRQVVGEAHGGLVSSRVVAAGDIIFFGGGAHGPNGALDPAAVPPPPYGASVTAQVRAQTDVMFARYRADLQAVGCDLDDIVQIEQYITEKRLADGYTQVARGPRYLADPDRRPSSFMVRCGPMLPVGGVVATTGFAVDPRTGWGKERVELDPDVVGFEAPAGFGHVIRSGPFVLTTVWPSDYATGVHPSVEVPQWVWWESEIRNEAEWVVQQLRAKLQAAGSSIHDIVACTLVLSDPADLHEFDLVWRDAVGEAPPARTIVLVPGFGSPRWEGASGHRDGSTKMEIQVRAVRRGMGYDKQMVAGPGAETGWASPCVRSGPVVWCSGAVAYRSGDAAAQTADVLDALDEQLHEAGSSLGTSYRLRVQGVDVGALAAASAVIGRRLGDAPPVVTYLQVPVDAFYPGAKIAIDAVAAALADVAEG